MTDRTRLVKLVACALAAVALALGRASADEPIPVLIALEGVAGAGGPALSSRALGERGQAVLDAVRSDPLASEVRIGRTSREAVAAMVSGHALALPAVQEGGRVESLAFRGAEVAPSGGGLVSVHAEDRAADTETALVLDGLDVVGSFRSGGDTWYVRPLGGGATVVYRYDTARLRGHLSPVPVTAPPWRERMEEGGEGMRTLAPEPSRGSVAPAAMGSIDLLVVYMDGAAMREGNIRAAIQLGVDRTNRIWSQSGVGWALRLVGTRRIDFTEPEGFFEGPHDPDSRIYDPALQVLDDFTLYSVQRSKDELTDWTTDAVVPVSVLGAVYEWRDELGADVVIVVGGSPFHIRSSTK